MKKRIFIIFVSGLIIGALFFGGYVAYPVIQQQVGINGCDKTAGAFVCIWRTIASLSSTEASSNNPIFPVGANLEHALMTGSLLYAKNGDNTDWRPLVTNAPENAGSTGILVQNPMYQDTTLGTMFRQLNANDSDTTGGLGVGSALVVFQDGTPAGRDDVQGLRSGRRIGNSNDGSNVPAYASYYFSDPNGIYIRDKATRQPSQLQTINNSHTTGAADTPVVVTLAAVATAFHFLAKVSAFCSAGTSNITVTAGGTTIFATPATAIGTIQAHIDWPTALTADANQAMVVTLATCGAANTGTLTVQASSN